MPNDHSSRRLVLASRSPRRADLLRRAGFTFDIDPADIDEEKSTPGMLPAELALHLARAKARKLASDPRHAGNVILAADTVVAMGDMVIGKPKDVLDARRIIRLLIGATHIVITGVAVAVGGATHEDVRSKRVMSAVRMLSLTERQLEQYLASQLWRDKAGGYGIQDPSPIVTLAGGCRTNVIGLPMTTTAAMLSEVGMKPAS